MLGSVDLAMVLLIVDAEVLDINLSDQDKLAPHYIVDDRHLSDFLFVASFEFYIVFPFVFPLVYPFSRYLLLLNLLLNFSISLKICCDGWAPALLFWLTSLNE